MDLPQAPEIKTGLYRHYKGALVEVFGAALHSENLEPFVLYKHLTGPHAGERHFWVRPLAIFQGSVEKDGKPTLRFTPEE